MKFNIYDDELLEQEERDMTNVNTHILVNKFGTYTEEKKEKVLHKLLAVRTHLSSLPLTDDVRHAMKQVLDLQNLLRLYKCTLSAKGIEFLNETVGNHYEAINTLFEHMHETHTQRQKQIARMNDMNEIVKNLSKAITKQQQRSTIMVSSKQYDKLSALGFFDEESDADKAIQRIPKLLNKVKK